jgi:hypothetical protein
MPLGGAYRYGVMGFPLRFQPQCLSWHSDIPVKGFLRNRFALAGKKIVFYSTDSGFLFPVYPFRGNTA